MCIRDRAKKEQLLKARLEASKARRASGTQNTAVEESPETETPDKEQEEDGKPSYDELLIALGFQNVSVEDDARSVQSYADVVRGAQGIRIGIEESDEDTLDGIGCFGGGEIVQKRVTFTPTTKKGQVARAGANQRTRRTLSPWKLYLDSCATYSSMFVKWFLDNIGPSPYHLKGHCNAGTLTCKEQGYYGPFKMWLNSQGITNLFLIP